MCNLVVWFEDNAGNPIFFTSEDAQSDRARQLQKWYAKKTEKGDTWKPLESHGDLAAYLCGAELPVDYDEEGAAKFLAAAGDYSYSRHHGESPCYAHWPAAMREAFDKGELPLTLEQLRELLPLQAGEVGARERMRGRADALTALRVFLDAVEGGETRGSIEEDAYARGYADGEDAIRKEEEYREDVLHAVEGASGKINAIMEALYNEV